MKNSYYIGPMSNLSSESWRACDMFFSPKMAPRPLCFQAEVRGFLKGVITYTIYKRCCSARRKHHVRFPPGQRNLYKADPPCSFPKEAATSRLSYTLPEKLLAPSKRQFPSSQTIDVKIQLSQSTPRIHQRGPWKVLCYCFTHDRSQTHFFQNRFFYILIFKDCTVFRHANIVTFTKANLLAIIF